MPKRKELRKSNSEGAGYYKSALALLLATILITGVGYEVLMKGGSASDSIANPTAIFATAIEADTLAAQNAELITPQGVELSESTTVDMLRATALKVELIGQDNTIGTAEAGLVTKDGRFYIIFAKHMLTDENGQPFKHMVISGAGLAEPIRVDQTKIVDTQPQFPEALVYFALDHDQVNQDQKLQTSIPEWTTGTSELRVGQYLAIPHFTGTTVEFSIVSITQVDLPNGLVNVSPIQINADGSAEVVTQPSQITATDNLLGPICDGDSGSIAFAAQLNYNAAGQLTVIIEDRTLGLVMAGPDTSDPNIAQSLYTQGYNDCTTNAILVIPSLN